MPREDPVSVLERWRDHGAYYRILYLSDEKATVELLTCYGEAVERLESRDRRLISTCTVRMRTLAEAMTSATSVTADRGVLRHSTGWRST